MTEIREVLALSDEDYEPYLMISIGLYCDPEDGERKPVLVDYSDPRLVVLDAALAADVFRAIAELLPVELLPEVARAEFWGACEMPSEWGKPSDSEGYRP